MVACLLPTPLASCRFLIQICAQTSSRAKLGATSPFSDVVSIWIFRIMTLASIWQYGLESSYCQVFVVASYPPKFLAIHPRKLTEYIAK